MKKDSINYLLDYKSIVIENFQESVKQLEWRKQLTTDKNDPHIVRHLIECQTYYKLLIQYGVSISELNIIAERIKIEFLGKKI